MDILQFNYFKFSNDVINHRKIKQTFILTSGNTNIVLKHHETFEFNFNWLAINHVTAHKCQLLFWIHVNSLCYFCLALELVIVFALEGKKNNEINSGSELIKRRKRGVAWPRMQIAIVTTSNIRLEQKSFLFTIQPQLLISLDTNTSKSIKKLYNLLKTDCPKAVLTELEIQETLCVRIHPGRWWWNK